MTNNEIQQLIKGKNEKERFYILRRELVRNSCNEIKKKSEMYKNYIKKYPDNDYMVINPSIRTRALNILEDDGYLKEDKGTQYLASLITLLFHERKLYRRRDIEDNGYFDLSLKNNEHYSMLGDKPNKVREEIHKAMEHAKDYYTPIDELVYIITDNIMHLYKEDGSEKNNSYSKNIKMF